MKHFNILTRIFSKLPKVKHILLGFFILVTLIFVGFYAFVEITSYKPIEADYNAAMANSKVSIVENSDHFIIRPAEINPRLEPIIYYPGGLVNAKSYVYKLSEVAVQNNVTIYLIKSPFNAAIFNTNAAAGLIQKYNLNKPIIGGHSLGGISACRFAKDNPEKVSTLFLFGSYCDQNISNLAISVVSIMGKNDGIINKENYEKSKNNLPKSSTFLEIDGLNHSLFGNYGLQNGDNQGRLLSGEVVDTISRIVQ